MIMNATLQSDERRRLLIEGSRVSLFVIILLAGMISNIAQPAFINWATLGPFYGLVAVALGIHLFIVGGIERFFRSPTLLFGTFVLDAALISGLIYFSGLNQSLFLFLHLLNILIAGLVFRIQGALVVALLTSLFFTLAGLLGPDLKVLNFIFLLALNNIAFFLVAGLSGYLSEQLETVSEELQKAGLSLKAARELNRLVIESIPSGIMTFNESGEILQTNPAAAQILERNAAGENVFDLLRGFEPSPVRSSDRIDLKYESPAGGAPKLLGLMSSGFYSPELGAPIRVLVIEDLTRVRRLEWGLRQAEKMAAVGQLAAGIAHEIRNPLSGISGSVELLSQTTGNEDDRKLMGIILREIERLNHLITEFLEYSRPEQPPTDPVDLVPLIDEVLAGMKFAKNVRSDVEVVKGVPMRAEIRAHREKLKQALLNILLNAFQATENTLRPLIEVTLEDQGHQILFRVRDNGCGMSEATRKRMFEPFHTTKKKGTGLGLAVTHKILEGHGAQIFVESEEGRGTDFTLIFPSLKS